MAESRTHTLAILLQEVAEALIFPLYRALSSVSNFERFMRKIGWNVRSIPTPLQELQAELETLLETAIELRRVGFSAKNLGNTKRLVQQTISLIKGLRSVDLHPLAEDLETADELPEVIIHTLLVEHLQRRLPKVFEYGQLMGVISKTFRRQESEAWRISYFEQRIHFDRLLRLLQRPEEIIAKGWLDPIHSFLPVYFIDRLSTFVSNIGLGVSYEDFELNWIEGVTSQGKMANWIFFDTTKDDNYLRAGLRLMPSPRGAMPGVFILPYLLGNYDRRFPVSDRYELLLDTNLDFGKDLGLVFHPAMGIRQLPPGEGDQALGELQLSWQKRQPPPITKVLAWSEDSFVGFEAMTTSFGIRLTGITEAPDVYIETKMDQLLFRFAVPEQWSFLQEVLPEEGFEGSAEVVLGWSRAEGLYHRIDTTSNVSGLSMRTQLGGIKGLVAEFNIADHFALHLSTDEAVTIGPATVKIKGFGLQAKADYDVELNGNLGLLDLDFSFAPPTGLGFIIDAKAVKGGGFLDFKPDKGEYLGYAELEVLDKVNVKAIGLINTKLPDGQSGYSFLLMIVSEFDPLQLGLGFTLESVGGIIGLHRALHLENLRAGVRSDQFDHILFPDDTLANLSRILAGVNQLMPIRKDRYAFGLLGRFGWGSPKVLDIQAGLLFELPSWKLALIGVAKAEVKRKKKTLVRLQLDFAMTYDPAETFFSFDARLKNSKLLVWELSGDFAIRIRGGNDPQFLISAGGFHPDYQPPASLKLPSLERLKIAMKTGNPSIQAQAFFAITSNTFQFGAEAIAKYSKYGIKLEAELGFAALIQFDPLYFKATLWGGVELDFWGLAFGLSLRGTVEGPYPIKIDGYVKFKIWIFSKTVRIPTITIGESGSPALPKVDIWPLLRQQLADDRNWTTQLPSRRRPLVTLKSIPDATVRPIRMHPLGVLEIVQTQVPLQVHLDRFGAQQPGDYHQFSLQLAQTYSTTLPIRRHFAPAQFFDLSEAERFQRPAYESYPAGLRLDGWEKTSMGAVVHTHFDYERKIIVDEEVQAYESRPMRARYHDQLLNNTSQARARDGQRDRRRAQRQGHFVKSPTVYVVFDPHTDEQLAVGESWAEADQLRREWERTHPRTQGRLQVVLQSELETSTV